MKFVPPKTDSHIPKRKSFLTFFRRTDNGKPLTGFTLVEILIVVVIMVVILAFTLANYKDGNQRLTLNRTVYKLAQDIRKAQEMAMSTREFQGSIPLGGYGLILKNFTDGGIDFAHLYIIAADKDGDNNLILSEEVEQIKLESGIKISKLYSISGINETEVNTLFFNFIPPEPITCVYGCTADGAKIVLSLVSDPSITRTVVVNKTGLIKVIE